MLDKALQVQIIREIATKLGGDFREEYSGRNMFGRSCVAIDLDNRADAQEAIAAARRKGVLCVAHQDAMASGAIVYWPTVSMPEEVPS